MTNTQDVIALLPDWLKGGASAGLFVISCVIAFLGWKASLNKGEHDHEAREHDDALEVREAMAAGPVRDALTYLATLAENARLQTEALKVMAAAGTALAKTVEADFSERRIKDEVDRRLAMERQRLDAARA
jgi:hypothetical protein